MKKKRPLLSIEQIKERLAPLFESEDIQLVLLFGSTASGNVHKQSDIDLAFLLDTRFDVIEMTNRVTRLLRCDAVDIVDLRAAKPLLKYSAVKGGIVIYEKMAGIYNQFYSLAFRQFVDTRKLRDARQTSINNYLKAKGLV